MRRQLLLLVLLSAPVLSCRSCSTTASAAPPALEAGSGNDDSGPLDVESFRARAQVPAIGWAAITREDESSGAVGLADVERSDAASATTAFEAASIAKTIVATCVIQLVEERRLALDEDVSSYVGFPVRHPRLASPITLRHLLTHTASLADRPDTNATGEIALGDFLGRYFADAGAHAVFFDAAPGTTMTYSNVGPSLAALAVERLTGMRFADRAKASVFVPLGMRSTAFGFERLPPETRVAVPYASRGSSFVRLHPPSHALYPVVDLFATPRDLGRFARAILRGGELDGTRILSSAGVAEMLRVQLADAAPDDALGWQVRTLGGKRVFGHEGEDLGASTGLYVDMASGTGAVVLANGDAFQSADETRAAALAELVEKLLTTGASSARDR